MPCAIYKQTRRFRKLRIKKARKKEKKKTTLKTRWKLCAIYKNESNEIK